MVPQPVWYLNPHSSGLKKISSRNANQLNLSLLVTTGNSQPTAIRDPSAGTSRTQWHTHTCRRLWSAAKPSFDDGPCNFGWSELREEGGTRLKTAQAKEGPLQPSLPSCIVTTTACFQLDCQEISLLLVYKRSSAFIYEIVQQP